MYKEFVSEKQFNGMLGNLIEEIIEAFVNEEIGQSKLGEFYNIAGVVKIEDYGDFTFNEGIDTGGDGELDMDGVLDEEIIKQRITNHLLHKISNMSLELIDNNQIKASQVIMLNNQIKATYTLACS